MYPSSEIAMPILSSTWNLGLLGMIYRHNFSIPGAVGARWAEHFHSLNVHLVAIRKLLTDGFGFDDDISAMVMKGWADGPGWPDDEKDLDLYIGFAAGRPTQTRAGGTSARKALVDWAARRLLAMLLEGALLAEWAATKEGRHVQEGAIDALVALACSVAGEAAPFENAVVAQCATEWIHEEPWTTRDLPTELRNQVRARMRILALAE